VVLSQQAANTNVWNEIEFYRTAGELRTGLNGLAQGSARPGNVNRTAGGVSSQMQASALRLSTLVWNTETFGIVPILAKVLKFLQAHEAPGDYAAAQTDEGYGYVPTSSYYKPVTFIVKASSEMLSQERLREVLPMILQTFSNGPMVEGLSKAQMAVNWPRIAELIQKAAGTTDSYDLVVPMDEKQIAAMQQPPPQVQAMMQKAQMDNQRAIQLKQMDGQNALQLEQAKAQPNPMELQMEAQKAQLEIQMKQAELQFKERELQMKEREGQMKLQMKNMEMESKAKQAQLDQFLGVQKAQTDMALGQQKASVQSQQMERESQFAEQEHEFGMRSLGERSALEQKLNKDKMSMSQQRLKASKEKPQGAKASKPKE
jgi:hypothetical protein